MNENENQIIFQDEYSAMLIKKCGEDGQYFFKKYFPQKHYAEAVNRLDRPVSGLVIAAFSKELHTKFNEIFQNRLVQKEYWAICKKSTELELFQKKECSSHLVYNRKLQKSFITEKNTKAKKATLYWEATGQGKNYTFLRVYPVTGRTHQIRVQLASIGMPIKGDIKYGAARTEKGGGIKLHAYSIGFIHPVTEQKLFFSCLPDCKDNLWKAFMQTVNTTNSMRPLL